MSGSGSNSIGGI